MTIWRDPERLKQLREAADKNNEAGDWVAEDVPLVGMPIVSPQPVNDLMKRVGGIRLPAKK